MPPRGSGQFGPDVIVGSAEYAKLLRKKKPEAQRLAQAKYRAKQKELELATKLAKADTIPFEEALAEIQGRRDAITAVRSELIVEGRIDHHKKDPLEESEPDLPPIDTMVKESEEEGITYAEVKARYLAASRWNKPVQVDDELVRLATAKGLQAVSVSDMAKGENDGTDQEDGAVIPAEGRTAEGE